MHGDKSWFVLSPTLMATQHEKDKRATWAGIPTHCVYIDHPDGKIIWDAGVPRDWEQRWGPTGLIDWFPLDEVSEDMWLDSRLKQLGLQPGDIDYVLMSHLHYDHAGQLELWKGTSTKLVCNRDEYDGAFGIEGYSQGAHIKVDYDGLPFETVSEDTEILPGVTLLQTPGHTWGTMSLRVDLPDSGTMIFTSDSIYLKESYGPPATAAAIVYDTRKWFASVEKIRSLAEKTDATVVFGHDEEQLKQLKTIPACYT
jgi:glyoxylase-like metal-dependent hydrolase (beta-lactamase superfamily II)